MPPRPRPAPRPPFCCVRSWWVLEHWFRKHTSLLRFRDCSELTDLVPNAKLQMKGKGPVRKFSAFKVACGLQVFAKVSFAKVLQVLQAARLDTVAARTT